MAGGRLTVGALRLLGKGGVSSCKETEELNSELSSSSSKLSSEQEQSEEKSTSSNEKPFALGGIS